MSNFVFWVIFGPIYQINFGVLSWEVSIFNVNYYFDYLNEKSIFFDKIKTAEYLPMESIFWLQKIITSILMISSFQSILDQFGEWWWWASAPILWYQLFYFRTNFNGPKRGGTFSFILSMLIKPNIKRKVWNPSKIYFLLLFVGFLPIIYVKYQLNSILNLTSKWNWNSINTFRN